MTDLAGQYLGRYYLAERLGEGGMAVVYKAHDTRLERDVAIKIIRSGAFPMDALGEVLKRFEREAKSLAKLSHPNIVKVHDYGEHEGSPYIVMEYMPGGTLKKILGKPIPWQIALRLLLPVARGVEYAHQRGIVHRDIKPTNILITESGDPMLSDFGIAKLFEADQTTNLTGTGMAVGTPEYMAPEQWDGKPNPQSDLYSLGIVLYEMVTGRKPYIADTPVSLLLKQATEPVPPPHQFVADLPEATESLLVKSLARDPRDRFADMKTLIRAMEALLASAPTVQSPQLDPDAPYKATLAPQVISTQIEPQHGRDADLLPGAPRTPMPKSDSIPAIKDQTGPVRSTTRLRRASPFGLFAIFGGVGLFAILGIGVVMLILLPGMLPGSVTSVPTPTLAQVLPMVLPTSTPSQTPVPELGFTLVEPQEVLKIAPGLGVLSDLAVEKYSNASWNKVNGRLIFTINSQPEVPMVWLWGWCATSDEILEQNMAKIVVVFNADGYTIPKDRLANETYESTDPDYKGWKCRNYLTVLRDWKPGTYRLTETITFSSAINDGKDTFEAGNMTREYTVNIAP
jgi:eukaryotic-like serine/threonine-protein kinase